MKGMRGVIAAGLCSLALGACDDLLTVSDPQRYTADDLDSALPAVANGVEGALHEVVDSWAVDMALLSDEYQHTGTWSGYDEVDHGRFQYATSSLDGEHNAWLRARWFAEDAERRFDRVLEGAAANDPLMAQVHMTAGLTDLYMGMTFCESPAVSSGPSVTDMQILAQAVEKLTRAMATAQAAGTPDFALAAQAGRARANLLLGNYAAAASDAAAIPDGFSYDAIFNIQSTNGMVTLTTKTYNEAAGIMFKWWDQIDESTTSGFMRDPWTDAPDPRLPVFYDGEIATDNETPHYSQWKYSKETDDIPMVHSDGMRLIQAEVAMNNGDDAGALAIFNTLRANVGLAPLPAPSGGVTMMDYLLSERFAELFMEGMRQVDLHRFGIVQDIFDEIEVMAVALDATGRLNTAQSGERPSTGRPTKFPMTDTEPTYNNSITNDLLQRCLPKS
jgi:hypothetical protein